MSRNLIISVIASILLHGGAAASGFLMKSKPEEPAAVPETPTIALDLPPPIEPEPEEPEIVETSEVLDAPSDISELAPPMQADTISAALDSPFVQQVQAPPPPNLGRPSGGAITIPTNTRPPVGGAKAIGNVFDLASLDQRPEPRVRPAPVYPFELRRAGLKGEVVVGFIVDAEGNVRDPYIISTTNSGFDRAAMEATLKWKFKPGKKGGKAVNTRMSQPLTFSIKTN